MSFGRWRQQLDIILALQWLSQGVIRNCLNLFGIDEVAKVNHPGDVPFLHCLAKDPSRIFEIIWLLANKCTPRCNEQCEDIQLSR